MRDFEDRELLRRAARDGCPESLEVIYGKYRPMICDFLHKSGADGMAEDICQSVFMQIRDGKCKYNGRGDVKSYLFGVATILLKQELEAVCKNASYLRHLKESGDTYKHVAVDSCPIRIVETAESHKKLKKAVAELPPKASRAVKRVYLEEKTRQEAAEELGCDYFSICHSIRYGLKKLIEKFSDKS